MTTAGPWSFTAYTANNNRKTLTWADPNNSNIVKYQYRKKTGTGSFGNWANISSSDEETTSYDASCSTGRVCTVEVRPVVHPASDVATATPPSGKTSNFVAGTVEGRLDGHPAPRWRRHVPTRSPGLTAGKEYLFQVAPVKRINKR